MSGFSTDWLTLREPLDASARSAKILASLSGDAQRGAQEHWHVVDLGSGTGAALRYAAPRLGGLQDWVLVEKDPLLVAATADAMRGWVLTHKATVQTEGPSSLSAQGPGFQCRMRHLNLDLATQLAHLPLRPRSLIVASALLDLVSEEWLRMLIGRASAEKATLWFTMTYDGRTECEPRDPQDQLALELFNLHQQTDKGFGVALGPRAALLAQRLLTAGGYRVAQARSDWQLGTKHELLQRALIDGWHRAACEADPSRPGLLRDWHARRLAQLGRAETKLMVGHVDMVARPPI